jgi:hypothetical protein
MKICVAAINAFRGRGRGRVGDEIDLQAVSVIKEAATE